MRRHHAGTNHFGLGNLAELRSGVIRSQTDSTAEVRPPPDCSQKGARAEIARAVVVAGQRGHLDGVSTAGGVQKLVAAEVDPHVRDFAAAAGGEKYQVSLGQFRSIDRPARRPLLAGGPRQVQPVELIDDHGEPAAVEARNRRFSAPLVRHADEALRGSDDFVAELGLAHGLRLRRGVIPRRDDEVLVDDAGRFQPFRPFHGLLARGEVADAHLVEARFVDEVIGGQLAGQEPLGEPYGVVDVFESAGLNGVAQRRQDRLGTERRRLGPHPGLPAAA